MWVKRIKRILIEFGVVFKFCKLIDDTYRKSKVYCTQIHVNANVYMDQKQFPLFYQLFNYHKTDIA